MTNNTPDYEDNLYFDSQNTKKDLRITDDTLTEQWVNIYKSKKNTEVIGLVLFVTKLKKKLLRI